MGKPCHGLMWVMKTEKDEILALSLPRRDRFRLGRAMQSIIFRPTADTLGLPNPPIPDGTIVILVQDGVATIGRYEAPTPPENPAPAFDHPINDDELAGEAVLAEHPEIDLHGPASIFVCPDKIAVRAV